MIGEIIILKGLDRNSAFKPAFDNKHEKPH
jgi:hypothetical protein